MLTQIITKAPAHPTILPERKRRAVWERAAGAWKGRGAARIRALGASRRQWARRAAR